MRQMLMLGMVAFGCAAAFAGNWDKATLKGATDKANPVAYKVGEPIKFKLLLEGCDAAGEELTVVWTRRGDDGKKEDGQSKIVPGQPVEVVTRLDRPGFVRLEAYVHGADGKDLSRGCNAPGENWFGERRVFFDGGAGVEIEKLRQGAAEPADFDAFWRRQKARLDKVPVKARRWEVKSPRKELKVYAVQVDCAGPRPVTGYLSVPVNVADGKGKCGARVTFDGYGTGVQRAPGALWDIWHMEFHINAHGYDLEKDDAYYKDFFEHTKSNGKGYAFDPVQNGDPEKCYFNGMVLRVLRALQYVESLPEWNGHDLQVEGGSQGGLQTMWAAALDPKVSKAMPNITWCSDIGKRGAGRQGSEFEPAYTDALRYYDTVNMAKRVKCEVEVTRAGLGDYTCPPSGLAVCYNALRCRKSCLWVQGSRHGYIPPKPNQEFKSEAAAR